MTGESSPAKARAFPSFAYKGAPTDEFISRYPLALSIYFVMRLTAVRLLLVSVAGCCAALQPSRLGVVGSAKGCHQQPAIRRREAVIGAAGAAVAIALPAAPAFASGGATAGRTTSIPRAKLRYYGRMTAVVTAYQALGASIQAGNAKQAAAAFFSEEDEAPLAELKSAGYLLSVAFKMYVPRVPA